MPQTCGNILVHAIFSTKQRLPLIVPHVRNDLFAYIGGIVRELHGTALIVNGTFDHAHMLMRIRPVQSVAEIIRVVKANSSRWMHEQSQPRFAWQAGYGAFSVSQSSVDAVTRYIATQEDHHRKYSFQEELVSFLKRNHVAYDERYIWQ